MDTYRVGSNIDSWCTKCKLILAHTIEALASGSIRRVQCNTCGGKHQYKSAAPGTKSAAPQMKSSRVPKNKSRASDYEKLLKGRDAHGAHQYKISKQFSKGDVISHTTFGVGVVVEQRDPTKIEVLFESGPKILVHARS